MTTTDDPTNTTLAIATAANFIRARMAAPPEVGVIAGSGLSGLADRVRDAWRLTYAAIPGWPVSTVAGHAGELVVGTLGGRSVVIAAGRAHLYEGYTPFQATFNVRVMHALGVATVVVTNAAGGIDADYRAGDLMLITDHINLPGMAGFNPLAGANDEAVGPRFPGMVGAYDAALQALARGAAEAAGFRVHAGVYAMVAGPSFETPAELRFLRAIGADAVGMSTAPEVVVARHAGLRVLGISLITNVVRFDQPAEGEAVEADLHDEVTAAGAAAAARLAGVIEAVVGGA